MRSCAAMSAPRGRAYRKGTGLIRCLETTDQVRAARAQAAEEINQFRSTYATKLQFDYPLRPKAARAPFCFRDLSRRRVHLHPLRARGKTRSLRDQGRQAEPNLVPTRERRLHRTQNSSTPATRHRKKEATFTRQTRRELRTNDEPTFHNSGESAEAGRPSAEERAVLAAYRPRLSHGAIMWLTGDKKPSRAPQDRVPPANTAEYQ